MQKNKTMTEVPTFMEPTTTTGDKIEYNKQLKTSNNIVNDMHYKEHNFDEDEFVDYPYIGIGTKPSKRAYLSDTQLENLIGG